MDQKKEGFCKFFFGNFSRELIHFLYFYYFVLINDCGGADGVR